MTVRLYRDDPYLLEFDAHVIERRDHESRPAVLLDRTAFYAESGGQPWDTGTLGGVPVVAVVEEGDAILHALGAPLDATTVHGRVDGDRRRDHRQQHHGQHLLSRAFVETASARTVSFHLGADVSTIDLHREVGDAETVKAETLANEVIWEARPVRVRTVTREEALRLGVEPPEGAGDDIRLVEAEGFDVQPCGGTHPRSTAEVGVVAVLGRERYKGGSRIRFVCGHRALDSFRKRSTVLDRLGALLSSPLEQLPETAERLQSQLTEVERRSRDLLGRALEGEARRLLDSSGAPPALVVAVYDGWTPADLRTLALRLVAMSPCVALLGSRGEKAQIVFAQSDGLPHDIPALLREAAEFLGGRGGGKGNLAQGGGDRLDALPAALERAASRVRGASKGP